MKRVIMITACALCITAVKVNAQAGAKTTGVRFGLRAGANLSNVTKDANADFSTGSKIGVNAAAFLELPLANVFSIQPELQFSQKGFKNSGTFLGNPYEYKQTTNFIEVPVLAKIKPTKNFGILVGPQFSFLASTKTNFTTTNASYESLVKEDNNNLRKNILGGVIGIEASAANFVVGLRYNVDFQTNNGDGTSSTPKYKNQVTSLSVGFIF
jgi:hypothetical protein